MPDAPNIVIEVRANTTCDSLVLNDVTTYAGSAITASQVTEVRTTLAYSSIGASIEYIFTVATEVVTAATLSVGGADPTDISSYIGTTLPDRFPLTDFDMTADYGVTIPDVEDGVYYTTYEVSGSSGGEELSYTGTEEVVVMCSACCCVSSMFANLDPECACDDKAFMKAMRAQAYLNAAKYATQVGNIDNAVASLNLATEICNGNCGCN